MPGIGGALDIARWTLYSTQLAFEVTAHNIANANTEGYSRQKVEIEPNTPLKMGPGEIGTGARATQVIRQYDDFISEQINTKNSQYYYWQSQYEALGQIEAIFNESDEYGLNKIMGDFWNAWSDLSNNPDGIPEREALLETSQKLVQFIGDLDYNLRECQRHIDTVTQGSIEQINSITSQIAELNKQISSVEIKGFINANDLRDQRDKLLSQLSEYVDISYYEEKSSGQVMVFVLGGTPLVLGKDSLNIEAQRNATTGLTDLIWKDDSGRTVNITNKLEGGKVAGWVNVRDNKIGSYIDSLNTLTQALTWQVNSLQSEGVGLKSVSSMVGTVDIASLSDDLSTDFMFSDGYNAGGQFDIVAYDSSGNVSHIYTINPAGSTVNDLITEINAEAAAGGSEFTASLTNGTDGNFQIQANGNYTFALKAHGDSESNHALAIMGVNTFFSWTEDTGEPPDDLTETLDVNSAIKADSELIAAGTLDNNNKVAPGSNDVALAIASLQDKVIPDLGGTGVDTTLDSYYSSFIACVGIDVQNAEMNEKFNDSLLNQYIQKKESITGVNLDEEMTEILKNQHLYQAAAKLISICDEMMQTLLSTK